MNVFWTHFNHFVLVVILLATYFVLECSGCPSFVTKWWKKDSKKEVRLHYLINPATAYLLPRTYLWFSFFHSLSSLTVFMWQGDSVLVSLSYIEAVNLQHHSFFVRRHERNIIIIYFTVDQVLRVRTHSTRIFGLLQKWSQSLWTNQSIFSRMVISSTTRKWCFCFVFRFPVALFIYDTGIVILVSLSSIKQMAPGLVFPKTCSWYTCSLPMYFTEAQDLRPQKLPEKTFKIQSRWAEFGLGVSIAWASSYLVDI